MSATPAELDRAADILRHGGVVAFPTETVYGLGANALSPAAVARVFEIKGRPRFDPLIVHVAGQAEAEQLALQFSRLAARLAERFWPGPLTLVLPRREIVPDIVTSDLPSVALRVPDHPMALELIRKTGRPLAAPSANPFGQISPTTAEHVRSQLGPLVDAILDGGPCRVGVESTVLWLAGEGPPRLLRPGGVPLEEIQALAGEVLLGPPPEEEGETTAAHPLAPGMLARHYAPRTSLTLVQEGQAAHLGGEAAGLLAWRCCDSPERWKNVEILSTTGDLREAAANLFAALRRLDAAGCASLVAERVPDQGLGRAINDRLHRASHQ